MAWESLERTLAWGLFWLGGKAVVRAGVWTFDWSQRREQRGFLISLPSHGTEKEERGVRLKSCQTPKTEVRFYYSHRVEFVISLLCKQMLPTESVTWTFPHRKLNLPSSRVVPWKVREPHSGTSLPLCILMALWRYGIMGRRWPRTLTVSPAWLFSQVAPDGFVSLPAWQKRLSCQILPLPWDNSLLPCDQISLV